MSDHYPAQDPFPASISAGQLVQALLQMPPEAVVYGLSESSLHHIVGVVMNGDDVILEERTR